MCGCNNGRVPSRSIARRIAAPRISNPRVVPRAAPSPPVPTSPVPIFSPVRGRYRTSALFQPTPTPPTYNPDTSVWGASLWKILHTLAEFSDNSPLWFDILTSMESYIPCPHCKFHFVEYKSQNPPSADHQGIVNWFYHFHNSVNLRIGKPFFDSSGLPTGDKSTLLSQLLPLIDSLSISFPPEFISLLQTMRTSLL